MKLPTFKASKRFLREFEIPCFAAKIKNSKLPGVAAGHIAEFKDNRTCEIFLRGKFPKKVSGWQQTILKQLFTKNGLATAIEEAMKDYGKDPDAYSDCTEEEQKEMRKTGVAPYIWLSVIVIDEIKKEVILVGGSERVGHIVEHGLSIYLRKGRWRWAEADYFIRYQASFEENKPMTEAELLAAYDKEIKQMAGELQALVESPANAQKRWNEMFPTPSTGTPLLTDASFLCGNWKFDPVKTAEVLKRMGEKRSIAECKRNWGENVYRISDKAVSLFSGKDLLVEEDIHESKRHGKRVFIRHPNALDSDLRGAFGDLNEACAEKLPGFSFAIPDGMKPEDHFETSEYWCDGELLVDHTGLAYRRVK